MVGIKNCVVTYSNVEASCNVGVLENGCFRSAYLLKWIMFRKEQLCK